MDVKRELDDRGFERITIKSPKMKSHIYIQKCEDGYSSYEVKVEKGKVPVDFTGWYTTPDFALRDVKKYLENKPKTVSVKRDEKYARRHASTTPKDDKK